MPVPAVPVVAIEAQSLTTAMLKKVPCHAARLFDLIMCRLTTGSDDVTAFLNLPIEVLCQYVQVACLGTT